ncbi:MAG: hypothetical protein ACREE9_10540 [Stellaceae bacterium]
MRLSHVKRPPIPFADYALRLGLPPHPDAGKAKSNLSRTLRTMAGYGLVRLERGERGRITPRVTHDRVELDLPLTGSRKAG